MTGSVLKAVFQSTGPLTEADIKDLPNKPIPVYTTRPRNSPTVVHNLRIRDKPTDGVMNEDHADHEAWIKVRANLKKPYDKAIKFGAVLYSLAQAADIAEKKVHPVPTTWPPYSGKQAFGRIVGPHVARDLMIQELRERKRPKAPTQLPDTHLLQCDELRICLKCAGHDSWSALEKRLVDCGLKRNFEISMETLTIFSTDDVVTAMATCFCHLKKQPDRSPSTMPVRKVRCLDTGVQRTYSTPGYVSSSKNFECSGCKANFGQRTKFEHHQKQCQKFLKTQKVLNFARTS